MNSEYSKRITRALVVIAAALCALCALLGGQVLALGAVVGGTVAIVNWLAFVWLVGAIVHGRVAHRTAASILLGAKLVLVLVVCWALLTRFSVHPLGFAVGASSLLLSIMFAGLVAPKSQSLQAGGEV